MRCRFVRQISDVSENQSDSQNTEILEVCLEGLLVGERVSNYQLHK